MADIFISRSKTHRAADPLGMKVVASCRFSIFPVTTFFQELLVIDLRLAGLAVAAIFAFGAWAGDALELTGREIEENFADRFVTAMRTTVVSAGRVERGREACA